MMQRRIELPRLEIRCQAAGLRALRQDQFARPAHAVLGVDRQRERGRFQRQRQRAAGRARAASPGAHVAIQEQAIAGLQHDLAAVAGQIQRPQAAAAWRVDGQARARGVQHGARAHHDGDITGALGDAGRVPVQRAAQQDAAARLRLAVAAAVDVHAAGGAAGDVQRRRAADPDGAVVRPARGVVAHIGGRRDDIRLDAAAGRAQRAVHGDTAVAAAQQADRAARIDRHQRARADIDVRAILDALRAQRQVRAGALRQRALERVLLVHRRQQQRRRRPLARGLVARLVSVHRHDHVQCRALGHAQAATTVDVVFREARAQQRRIEQQGLGLLRADLRMGLPVGQRIGRADHHLPIRLQRQRAAAGHAMAAQLPRQRQRARGALHFRRARPQRDVAALARARLAPVQHRAARRHIDQRARRHRDAVRRVQRHAAAVEPAQPRRGHALALQVRPAAAHVQRRALA